MIVSTHQRKTQTGLHFGNRAQRDIDEATVLSDARYQVLPDRKNCIVCARPLIRAVNLSPVEVRHRRNVFHPACSLACRRQYLEWLNGT